MHTGRGVVRRSALATHSALALVLGDKEPRAEAPVEHEQLPGGHLLDLHLLLAPPVILQHLPVRDPLGAQAHRMLRHHVIVVLKHAIKGPCLSPQSWHWQPRLCSWNELHGHQRGYSAPGALIDVRRCARHVRILAHGHTLMPLKMHELSGAVSTA